MLTKDDLQQIQKMLDVQRESILSEVDEKLDMQRSKIMFEVRILLRQELDEIRERIDRLKVTEDEDIRMMNRDVEKLRKQLRKYELERAKPKSRG